MQWRGDKIQIFRNLEASEIAVFGQIRMASTKKTGALEKKLIEKFPDAEVRRDGDEIAIFLADDRFRIPDWANSYHCAVTRPATK
jgi:hypothetical protein